jgi:hypothetical protein
MSLLIAAHFRNSWNQTGHSHPHFLFHIDFRALLRFYHSSCRKPSFAQIRRANGIKILWALPFRSGYSSFTDIQNSVNSMVLNFVFNVLSQDNSIRFSSSSAVNSDGAVAINGSWILANLSTLLFWKYFSNQVMSCDKCSSKWISHLERNQLQWRSNIFATRGNSLCLRLHSFFFSITLIFFTKAKIFSIDFKRCMLLPCRERFRAFSFQKCHINMLLLPTNLHSQKLGIFVFHLFKEKYKFLVAVQTYEKVHYHEKAIAKYCSTTKTCVRIPYPHIVFFNLAFNGRVLL